VKGLGAHIILTRDDAKRVFGGQDDAEVRKIVRELRNSPKHRASKLVLETGTAWDGIHRCLTDGTLDATAGDFPVNHAILGGKRLHRGPEFEAIMVRPDIVPHVAEALHCQKRHEMHDKFMQLDPTSFGHAPTDREFDKTWNLLQQIRQLFEDAANERCAVLFTVDRE
jgi:hypothetical protein